MTPDELMRRFDAGERDPDLLRQLGHLAWQEFHDPWELPPALGAVQEEAPAADPGQPPADEVQERAQPFTVDTLVRYLRASGLPFWESGASAYTASWDYDPAIDRCTQAFFSVEGADQGILSARWVSDRRVPAEHFDRAFRLCNQWNSEWHWPRAYLDIPRLAGGRDGADPASGILALDLHLYLAKGIHQGLFDSQVCAAQAASWNFWELANREYRL